MNRFNFLGNLCWKKSLVFFAKNVAKNAKNIFIPETRLKVQGLRRAEEQHRKVFEILEPAKSKIQSGVFIYVKKVKTNTFYT